jgi:hypothetical protein
MGLVVVVENASAFPVVVGTPSKVRGPPRTDMSLSQGTTEISTVDGAVS